MKRALLLILLTMGCAPKSTQKQLPVAKTEFGPNTKDVALDLNLLKQKTSSQLLERLPGVHYLSTSAEILEFSEQLMILSQSERDSVQAQKFADAAERVRSAFYSNSKNYSTFNHETAPYLELALGIAYDTEGNHGISDLDKLIGDELDRETLNIERAVKKLKIKISPQTTEVPDILKTFDQLVDFLLALPSQLRSAGVGAEVASQMQKKIDTTFSPELDRVRSQLAMMSMKLTPEGNLSKLEGAMTGFSLLPAPIRNGFLKDLEPAKDLLKKINQVQNTDQFFDLLFVLWNHPMVDRQAIRKESPQLFDFMNGMTLEEMEWLRAQNREIEATRKKSAWQRFWDNNKKSFEIWWKSASSFSADPMILIAKMEAGKAYVWYLGLDTVKNQLKASINKAIFIQFESKIRSREQEFSQAIAQVIVDMTRAEFGKIKADIKGFLRTKGREQLKAHLFTHTDHMIAYEDKRAALVMDKSKKLKTVSLRPEADRRILTDARTAGASLALQGRRLLNMDRDHSLAKDTPTFFEEVFTPLNKMMAIVGFRYMEESRPRFPGLFRKISGKGGLYDMDIFHYDREPGFFAVPKEVVVQQDFRIDAKETLKNGLVAGVGDNAELIRGAAVLMEYLRDWVKNSYDAPRGLGEAEFKGVSIFPKKSFFALDVGVISVPFRNLTRNGMVIFGRSGKQYESAEYKSNDPHPESMECPKVFGIPDAQFPDDPKKIDPILMTALTSVSPNGRGDVVSSNEMARMILAIAEFIRVTDGAEASQADPLKDRATLKALVCGRHSLRLLMMGLGNFLTSKFQRPDGGFARFYSLKQMALVPQIDGENQENRYLEDQLLVMQALKEVHDLFKGKAYAYLATDTYHFLNRRLFDSDLGFYRTREISVAKETKADPRLMGLALNTIRKIQEILPAEDLAQAKELERFWSARLSDFAGVWK